VRKIAVVLAAVLLVVVLPEASAAAVPSFHEPGSPLGAAAVPQGQFRAYWVDAFGDGMYTPGQIDDVIAQTKAINANAIIAQVVRRGDCFCNRAAAARTEQAGVDAAPFDPLQSLIDKAHANGIQVHAWVIATAIWRGNTPPADPSHVFNIHGTSATGQANWLTKRSDGLQQLNTDWILDPGHPDAAQWIVDVATSIVRSYNVDGINLDRIRYPDNNLGTNVPSWGYNPTAVARFQQQTGRADVPGNSDAQWTQWRRDQITAIVRKVYIESFAIRPSVRVSADTISYGYGPQHGGGFTGTRTYAEVLQDWDGWMREGILDTNIVMNYKRQLTVNQDVMYKEWSDYAKDNPYNRQSVIGTGLYLNDIASSTTQARIAVAPSSAGNVGAGWAGYSYRTPDAMTDAGTRTGAASRAELSKALTQPSSYDSTTPAVFSGIAPVPPMTWKTQPTMGHIRWTATPGARVDLLIDGVPVRSTVADGKGWFAFVDVLPGVYGVASAGVSLGQARVVAGGLAGLTQVGSTPTPSPTASPSAPPSASPSPSPSPTPGACTSTEGPGIAPPTSIPAGIPGFHSAWFGQSGYMTLCPGDTRTATVAYYNTGARGWVLGRMGEVAYLGTWRPEPGQDAPSPLGGDGSLGSPNTGWPRYDRIAIQPSAYVGPGQVSWFQFTVKAPMTAGTYKLYLRPLVEGSTWMEDFGVFWVVTVK
jgi:uncharacterized lipoprotein YddW (UPF0748 family)